MRKKQYDNSDNKFVKRIIKDILIRATAISKR